MPRSTVTNQMRTLARAAQQCYYSQGFLIDAALADPAKSVADVMAQRGRTPSDLVGGGTIGFLITATHFLHDVAKPSAPAFCSIVQAHSTKPLNICLNKLVGIDGGDRKVAVVRHLRNSFAHYRFETHDLAKDDDSWIQLRDFFPNGDPSFRAGCSVMALRKYVEQLFVPCYQDFVQENDIGG